MDQSHCVDDVADYLVERARRFYALTSADIAMPELLGLVYRDQPVQIVHLEQTAFGPSEGDTGDERRAASAIVSSAMLNEPDCLGAVHLSEAWASALARTSGVRPAQASDRQDVLCVVVSPRDAEPRTRMFAIRPSTLGSEARDLVEMKI